MLLIIIYTLNEGCNTAYYSHNSSPKRTKVTKLVFCRLNSYVCRQINEVTEVQNLVNID